jgi:hypothetical protein
MANYEVTNLVYSLEPDTVMWTCQGRTVEIKTPTAVRTVLIWDEPGLVVVLSGGMEGKYPPDRLLIYESDGKLRHSLSPPDGYEFYSIIPHPTWGVTVVCGIKDPMNPWQEWNFRIDHRRGTLIRYSPNK